MRNGDMPPPRLVLRRRFVDWDNPVREPADLVDVRRPRAGPGGRPEPALRGAVQARQKLRRAAPPEPGATRAVRGRDPNDPRSAGLATRLTRRPADGDAHGPAHAAARHRPALAAPWRHQGPAAPGHPAPKRDRASRGISRASGVRGAPVRRAAVAVAYPLAVRQRAGERRRARPRASLLLLGGAALLVVRPLPDPQPAASGGARPRRLPGEHEAAGGDPGDRDRVRSARDLSLLRTPAPLLG